MTNIYRPVAEDAGKELKEHLAEDVVVRGDGELLLQMIANLIENAIRHTPSQAKLAVTLDHGSRGPVIVVADTGPGIPPEYHAKVFERFYRLDASRTTPGDGLGLSLVAAVAALHDIHISLEDNKPGLKVLLQFSA